MLAGSGQIQQLAESTHEAPGKGMIRGVYGT